MTVEELAVTLDAELPQSAAPGYSVFDLVAAAGISEGDWVEFLQIALPEIAMLHIMGFGEAAVRLMGAGFALGRLAARNEKTLPKVQ